MKDEEFITELKYKEQYNPLRAEICVYGIDHDAIFHQKGLIIPRVTIGYFIEEGKKNVSKEQLKISFRSHISFDVQMGKFLFQRTKKVKKLESILLEEMKNSRIHVVEVDNSKMIKAVVNKHAELFCQQYEDLRNRIKTLYKHYMMENPSLDPFSQ